MYCAALRLSPLLPRPTLRNDSVRYLGSATASDRQDARLPAPDMSEGDTAAAKAAYAELVRNDSGAVRWMPDATPGSEGTRLFGQLADVQELNGASRPRPTLTPQVSLMMITPRLLFFSRNKRSYAALYTSGTNVRASHGLYSYPGNCRC